MNSAVKLRQELLLQSKKKNKLNGNQLNADSPWVRRPVPRPDAKLRVFCLPYAGGSPSVFQAWPEFFKNESIEICQIHLPGRESRIMDRMPDSFYILVQSIMKAIIPLIQVGDIPYIIYGHCMGSLISFQLCQEIRKRNRRESAAGQVQLPQHFFVGAHYAPELLHPTRKPTSYLKDLTQEEFFKIAEQLGGTEGAVLKDPTTGALVISTLSADYWMYGDYEYIPDEPFQFPITVICGLQDDLVKVEEAQGWAKETSAGCQFAELASGDHFFVIKEKEKLLPMLLEYFRQVLARIDKTREEVTKS